MALAARSCCFPHETFLSVLSQAPRGDRYANFHGLATEAIARALITEMDVYTVSEIDTLIRDNSDRLEKLAAAASYAVEMASNPTHRNLFFALVMLGLSTVPEGVLKRNVLARLKRVEMVCPDREWLTKVGADLLLYLGEILSWSNPRQARDADHVLDDPEILKQSNDAAAAS